MPVVRRQTFDVETVVLGGQAPIGLDYLRNPFGASVWIDLVSGDVDYAVEFTTDDIATMPPADLRWITDSSFPSGQTQSANFRVDTAATAIRLNIAELTGEVRFTVIQGLRE